jgi:putative DNA primase/helicase
LSASPQFRPSFAAQLARELNGTRSGDGWTAHCPAHDDRHPSLSISDGPDGTVLVHCHAGCAQDDLIAEIKDRGLPWPSPAKAKLSRIVATYDYTDEHGKVLYQIVRKHPKTFLQRFPDGNGGWIWKKHPRQVLYRLLRVLKAKGLHVVEGEKDVETMEDLGFIATTNAGGADAPWLDTFTKALSGKVVVLIPDQDPPGWERVLKIARALIGQARKVTIRKPADGAKDVTEWVEAHPGKKLQLGAPIEIVTAADVDALEEKLRSEGKLVPRVRPIRESDTFSLLTPLLNDHGNSERLIALYGEDLKYVHASRKYIVFLDSTRWAWDETGQAQRLAKRAMLSFLQEAIEASNETAQRFARASLDSKRIASLLSMAQSEIYVQPAQLDTHAHLLNFLNGTVDLRTGKLRPHDRSDFITKLIHYEYRPEAQCPCSLAFLNQLMGGGPSASEVESKRARRMVQFLQRAFGYSTTGSTIEKIVFVLFGDGNNGKTTLLFMIYTLLKEYAAQIQVETLMVRQESNNTQADLADLRGARFVQTSEAEEGQRLAQGKLKRITQGMGTIKAVRKYENPIEFPETHKLWIDTNRKPLIQDCDDKATFNRLHPIPFTVSIPKEKIDRDLPAKLLREAEGILAWIVEGARLWYAGGLQPPEEIESANREWRAEEDQLGRFFESACRLAPGLQVQARSLFAAYKDWADTSREHHILTENLFGRKLRLRGYEKKQRARGAFYLGIDIRTEEHDE